MHTHTADQIAAKLGIEKTALIRVRAGIAYALTEAMDEGHCGLPAEELISLTQTLLEVPAELVETALGLAITRLHREHKIPLARIVELFTAGPARVVDLRGRGTLARGSHADITILDPKKRWTFEAAMSRSKSHNTPFDGWHLTGKVVATIVSGKVVYRAD